MTINFFHPWMLLGLAGVGLPVLIHFLTRPRPRVIRYPTYHFLVEAGSGRQALNRLRTWVILLLRTLAVTSLVLLFAGLFLKSPGVTTEPGAARRVVLLVDASCSMQAVEGGVSLFAKARAQAADVLRSLEQGSQAGVIFIGARPRAVLPALSGNLSALHEGLSEADGTLEKGNPTAALGLAGRMLEGQGTVYVFSDFARTDWSAVDFAGLSNTAFFLRPVVENGLDNVGITAIAKSPGEPIEGETIELVCTVFNATATKRMETVNLDLEGVSQQADVELQPYSSGSATFTFSLPQIGCLPGQVWLGTEESGEHEDMDSLSADNRRYFKVRVRQALPCLVISDADRSDSGKAAFFVNTALCPSEYARTGMRVMYRLSQEVDVGALETADAFFLVPPVQLTGEAVQHICRRVGEGAHLVCFLDGEGSRTLLFALSGASEGAVRPPFELTRQVPSPSRQGESFAQVQVLAGPLKLFGASDQGDLKQFRFLRHHLTEIDSTRIEEVILFFADGSAALALSPAGRGSAVYVNFPIAPGGGNLAGSPLFPALLHEIMRALRQGTETNPNTPGLEWTIDALVGRESKEKDATFRIVTPDGRDVEAVVLARGRTVRLALPAVAKPGIYDIRLGQQSTGDFGVVNIHSKETDTRALDIRGLLDDGAVGGTTIAVLDREGQLVWAGKPKTLWPYLLVLTVFFLGLEMLLLALWRRLAQRATRQNLDGALRTAPTGGN